MRSVVLKGVEITIGSKVRFMDDSQLYEVYVISKHSEGNVHIVRDFSKKNGSTMKKYIKILFIVPTRMNIVGLGELGCALWCFEPIIAVA